MAVSMRMDPDSVWRPQTADPPDLTSLTSSILLVTATVKWRRKGSARLFIDRLTTPLANVTRPAHAHALSIRQFDRRSD